MPSLIQIGAIKGISREFDIGQEKARILMNLYMNLRLIRMTSPFGKQ
jgi:hypothetical protein